MAVLLCKSLLVPFFFLCSLSLFGKPWSVSEYGSDVIKGVVDTGVWTERWSLSDPNLSPVPAGWKGDLCESRNQFSPAHCNPELIGAGFFVRYHATINRTVMFRSPRVAEGHGTYMASKQGLWSGSEYGSDVIKGVFDVGIWQECRSFPDQNFSPVPAPWKGVCKSRFQFSPVHSNRDGWTHKAVVSRWVNAQGRGTQTAWMAVCRQAFYANTAEYAPGIAKGVAQKARLAVYKVCWINVYDGEDVISIYIGGGDGVYLDPLAMGAYEAVSKCVFVSSSAVNDEPKGMLVTNLAPCLTTIGAETIDPIFSADVILGDGRNAGELLNGGKPLNGKMFPLVFNPGKSGMLSANLLDPKIVTSKIGICDRRSSLRVAKGLVVKKSGGVGIVDGVSNGEGLVGDAHFLPSCAVGANEGYPVTSCISSSAPRNKIKISISISMRISLWGVLDFLAKFRWIHKRKY